MSLHLRTDRFTAPLPDAALAITIASAAWTGDRQAPEVADVGREAVAALPAASAGARLAFALNLLSAPSAHVPLARLGEIVAGGTDAARRLGLPLLGGHTLDVDALFSSVLRIEVVPATTEVGPPWEPAPPDPATPRRPVMGLSQVHGCGAKLPPEQLQELLPAMLVAVGEAAEHVLVNDDAVVLDLGGCTLAATVDVITPVTNDPADFGAIAAAGALSDVYAKSAAPVAAIAILGAPPGLDPGTLAWILDGGRRAVADAGARLLGLHELPSAELFFGLLVLGLGAPGSARPKAGVREGDLLVLTKPLGTGVISTIEKRTGLKDDPELLAQARRTMAGLNDGASRAAAMPGVSAITDVTGFSLAGHLIEMVAPNAALGARLYASRLPLLHPERLATYLSSGMAFCSMERNRHFLERHVRIAPAAASSVATEVLFDAQTSGGLLVAVARGRLTAFLERLAAEGCSEAAVVGQVVPRRAGILIELEDAPAEPWP